MKLISPTKEFENSWKAALQEFEEDGTDGFWNVPSKPTNFDEYIQLTQDNSKGLNLADNWVPATTYWLIDQGKFIGHVNIRHRLNDWLEKRGGNIGYAIRPTERQKGYGSKMLELALPKARELGINRALLTCDDDNTGSMKIIEKNAGKLQDKIEVDGKLLRRYWINL